MCRDRSGDSTDSTREDSIMCKLGSSALTTPMQVMPDPRLPALHEFLESEIGMLILCYSAPE